MNYTKLINEIIDENLNTSLYKKRNLKPEVIYITKQQVLEIITIAEAEAIKQQVIYEALLNHRTRLTPNLELSKAIQKKLINNLKK